MDIKLIDCKDQYKCSRCEGTVSAKYMLVSEKLGIHMPVCNKCIVKAKSKLYDKEQKFCHIA